jgi:hypothetical protein
MLVITIIMVLTAWRIVLGAVRVAGGRSGGSGGCRSVDR